MQREPKLVGRSRLIKEKEKHTSVGPEKKKESQNLLLLEHSAKSAGESARKSLR